MSRTEPTVFTIHILKNNYHTITISPYHPIIKAHSDDSYLFNYHPSITNCQLPCSKFITCPSFFVKYLTYYQRHSNKYYLTPGSHGYRHPGVSIVEMGV